MNLIWNVDFAYSLFVFFLSKFILQSSKKQRDVEQGKILLLS